jgi:mannosyl-3-phosphoglycerate phosphatase
MTNTIATPQWWVVTDLDGTLMDHHYDWSPAEPAIRRLQAAGIPVIPCTSKTAEEVIRFREQLDLHDPFIVENGGAIHGESSTGQPWGLPLGPGWVELKPQLSALELELGEPLRALDELTDAEGEQLLGLQGDVLRQAQRRCCSVPFVPPSADARLRLEALVEQRGLTVVQGNRLGHLLGPGISKGNALHVLKQHLNQPDVAVLALGDSPNDLPLLEAADLAVVVPGIEGPHPLLLPGLNSGRFQLAGAAHGAGWAEAVQRLLPPFFNKSCQSS